jgi:hydrogenase nickel incorporation protein HypA/HybF
MHEYAVTKNVLDIAIEEAQRCCASKVLSIRIVIGDLSAIMDDSVSMYFEFFSKGTVAENAKLEFVRVSAEFYCQSCNENFQKPKTGFECPKCGTTGKLTQRGKEFYVESIEIE